MIDMLVQRTRGLQELQVLPLVFLGIVLPFDFLAQVDAYLMYLRPTELILLFGWGWATYAAIGLVLSITVLVCAFLLAHLISKPVSTVAKVICTWLSLMVFIICLLKNGRTWIVATGISTTPNIDNHWRWLLFSAAAIACTAWVWRRGTLSRELIKLMRISAAVGLAVTLVSLVEEWIDRTGQLTPSITANRTADGHRLPDIIMISIDALTANHMSLYGYGRQTTPYLDQIVQKAFVFDRYYANSNYTTPAVNSILHGVRPWTHRANQLFAKTDMEIARRGLMPRLKSSGYQVMTVSTNPYASPDNNLTHYWVDRNDSGHIHVGFDVGMAMLGSISPEAMPIVNMATISSLLHALDPLLVNIGLWKLNDHFDPELALGAARRLVDSHAADRPMFLWVHLFQPHFPYAAQAPFLGRFDSGTQARTRFDSSPPEKFSAGDYQDFPKLYVGRYDEGVYSVDDHVGKFLEWLKTRNLFEKSLVIITADHGESFSHDYGAHGGPMLYEDLIHIPLIIKIPDQDTGKRLSVLGEEIDLMPTIIDLAGLPLDGKTEGKSLKPATLGNQENLPVFSMNFEPSSRFTKLVKGSVAMIDGRWKYVHYVGLSLKTKNEDIKDALYDLSSDSTESRSLIKSRPDIAAPMFAKIQSAIESH